MATGVDHGHEPSVGVTTCDDRHTEVVDRHEGSRFGKVTRKPDDLGVIAKEGLPLFGRVFRVDIHRRRIPAESPGVGVGAGVQLPDQLFDESDLRFVLHWNRPCVNVRLNLE